MTKRGWQIAAIVALIAGFAFLIWAFTSQTAVMYAVAASMFALTAIFGRNATR